MVTPLRKAASYEPRITILGIWGDTWLTRGKYGIYVAVRGSYGVYVDAFWKVERNFKMFNQLYIYCRASYVAVTRIPSLVLRNTWHYMYLIIRYSYGELPTFALRCSYEAAKLRKGVTTALRDSYAGWAITWMCGHRIRQWGKVYAWILRKQQNGCYKYNPVLRDITVNYDARLSFLECKQVCYFANS